MRVKLVDMYNTKYFYLSYCKDLEYLFTCYLNLRRNKDLKYHAGNALMQQVFDCAYANADVEFDLAKAKLTTDAISTIQRYANNGIIFVDSNDPLRNEILRINAQRKSTPIGERVTLPLVEFDMSLKDYLSSLSREVVYDAAQIPETERMLYPLAALILIRRPTIQLDLTYHLSDFMRFMSELLPLDFVLKFNKFYFTTTEGTRVVESQNGMINTQQRGPLSIEDAMTIGYLVPAELGTRNLSKEPVWSDVVSYCINVVNSCKKKKSLFLSEVV